MSGIFSTTPLAAYANDDHDDEEHDDHDEDNGDEDNGDEDNGNGNGDSSETSTDQELSQENLGSGESTNENCGTNSIDVALAIAICGDVDIGGDADGATPFDPEEKPSSHEDW